MSGASNFSPQSFAVVGAGPVGCIVACFLAKGGFEVTLCDGPGFRPRNYS